MDLAIKLMYVIQESSHDVLGILYGYGNLIFLKKQIQLKSS